MSTQETTRVHWWPAWRAHMASGRATWCGYHTGANTCSRPNRAGAEVIHCHRCDSGTLQARYARAVHRRIAGAT